MKFLKFCLPIAAVFTFACATPRTEVQNTTISHTFEVATAGGGQSVVAVSPPSDAIVTSVSSKSKAVPNGTNSTAAVENTTVSRPVIKNKTTSLMKTKSKTTGVVSANSSNVGIEKKVTEPSLTLREKLVKLAAAVFERNAPLVRFCRGVLFEFSAPKKTKNCEITYAKVKNKNTETLYEIKKCGSSWTVSELK